MTDRGYELVFRSSTAAEPTLSEHDVLSFDHLVLFAPASKCARLFQAETRFQTS